MAGAGEHYHIQNVIIADRESQGDQWRIIITLKQHAPSRQDVELDELQDNFSEYVLVSIITMRR